MKEMNVLAYLLLCCLHVYGKISHDVGSNDRYHGLFYQTIIHLTASFEIYTLLAHLSRRLIGELIVYPCSGGGVVVVNNFQT